MKACSTSLRLFLLFISSGSIAAQTGTNVGGRISSNTTWDLAGSPYTVTSTISIYSGSTTPVTLTIKPGVTVKFNSDTELQVGRVGYSSYPGVLIAEGTSASPITFTSSSGATNGWKGIYFANGSDYNGVKSSLKHCTVEMAGDTNSVSLHTGIYFNSTAGHTLDTVTVRSNTGYGIYMNSSSATFTGLVDSANTSDGMYLKNSSPTITTSRFKNNGGYGLHMNSGSRPTLSNNTYANNTSSGIAIDGGQIPSNTTWYKDGTHYLVTSTVSLYSGSTTPDTLTIKPGVTVKFNNDTELQVGRVDYSSYPGVLIAEGTSASPITFTSSSGATKGWKGIYFANGSDYGGNKSSLKHCVVENAGQSNHKDESSGIYFFNTFGHTVDNTSIKNNTGDGIYLNNSSATITNSTFDSNTNYGLRMNMTSRPSHTGNTYTNNTSGGIGIDGGQISSNWTWYKDGAPYVIAGTISLYLGSTTPDTLTIKPGVTVKFNSGTELQVGRVNNSSYPGVLIAEGTSSSPITFTSSSGTTNGWKGIYFANGSDYNGVKSSLKHCTVEMAGDTNSASLHTGIYFNSTAGHTLDTVTVRSNTGYGIYMNSSSATFTGLVDSANTKDGIYLVDSSPTIKNSRIKNNGGYGLHMNAGSRPTLSNNTHADNTSVGIAIEGGRIPANTTWYNDGAFYVVAGTISLYLGSSTPDTLTIKPGVTVKFNSGTELQVGRVGYSSYPGVLIAEGTSASPITFTSSSGATNGWKGIYFAGGTDYTGVKSSLKHCVVENAGESNYRSANSGLYFYNTSGHTLDNVTIRNNGGYAIQTNAINYIPVLGNLTLSGNTNAGIATGGGTTSGNITLGHYGEPTWTILSDVTVSGSDTLTVAPGVTVRFAPGSRLQIGSGSTNPGRLCAVGKLDSMITFTTTKDTMVGGWEGLYFDNASDYNNFTSQLKYCIIEKGGESTGNANIQTYYTTQPTIDSCIVRNSAKYGIWIRGTSVPTITHCDIHSHKNWYLYNNTSLSVTASDSYWGTQSGIDLEDRIEGSVSTTGMRTTSVFSKTDILTPPYSPVAEAASDSTVTVTWTASTSKAVSKYYLYRNDGYGDVDYSTAIDSVNHLTVTWTSRGLTKGLIYRFGIRAAKADGTPEENFDITAEGPAGGYLTSGAITVDTTWTAGGRPYRFVEGNVTVSSGKILTIDPGVTVKFRGDYYLQVDGGLRAIGTAADSIRFTSYNQNPARGDWYALKFTDSAVEDTNKLDYCVVEYAGSNSTENAAVYGKDSKLTVDHSIIRHNDENGIYMNGGDLTVSNTRVHHNTDNGVRNSSGTTVLTNVSSFSNDDYGIYMSSATLTLANSHVYQNTDRGVYHSSGDLVVSRTTVESNGQEGVYFSGTQLTIDDSTVVKNNGEHGIEVYGSLTLKNSYVQDNNAGNTNYYGVRIDRYNGELLIDSTQVTGNANGLYVRNAASGSVVQNSTISDNNQYGVNAGDADVTLHGNTITGNGTGVYATAAAILTRNLISGNSKGVLTSSSPRLSFNNLYGNTGYYLETTGASDIDARTNWWGTTDGSSIAAVIKDKLDDSQLGLVDYSPVLTDTVRWSDTTAPVFTGTAAGYESAAKTKELVSGEWYDHAFPYFEWSPATDAYPVVGYSLLFTEDTSASAVPDELPDVYDTTYTVSQTLANGKTYLLKGRAVDNNFNATGSKTMFVYKYDVGAPLPFDLTYPLDGDTVGIRPLFQWNAAQDSADGAGIEKYLVYIDSVKTDSTDGATTYLLVETPLPEGDHTWFVTAVDSAGHGRVSSQVWTMNVNMSAGGTFVSVALETPGEKSGDVTLEYSLFDESTGSVSLLAEYSTDGGTTWSPASVTGDTSDIPPSGYDGFLVWNSATDLPDREEKNVRVMLTLSTSTGSGWKDTTGVFTVDNYHFHSIDISLAESLPEYTGTVSVTYGLTDTTLDLLTIVPFYTVNDREWRPATILGEVEDLDSSRYDGTLVWDSGTDLAGEDIEGVRLKFVPTDGWKDGDADSTKAFHLDNNGIPSVVVSELEGEQTGDIPVQYVLSDNEGDTLDIRLHYSVDGGPGWRRASLSGDTTGITDYTGSVVWHSGEDLPGQDIEAVQLRLVPADRDVGRPDTTERFHLDNNGLPSVVTSDVTGEQADDVIIPYVLSDPENDTLSILCEYYDGGTAGWNPATVTGVTSGITQSRYSADITWNSRQDLSSADHDVLFRITPADNDSGHPDTVSITLDNNRVPGVQISAVSDTVAVETRIDFTLSDDENDTLTIAGFFSLDDGETWSEASLEGELSGLTAQDYDGSITWLVLHDVGFKRLDKVRFSLAPADRDPGVPDTTGYMTVLNYPADFNGDLRIDTDDLAIFAAAWNADPQDTLYDIGPAGGDVPELTPQPDGLLDFEDLMVFIQMWNWSFAHNGFTPEIATLAQGGSGAGSLALSQRFPEDPWKSDGTVTVDVSLKGKGLLMVDGIFSFDDSNLELTAVSGGGFFKGVFESAPFFHQVSPDSDAVLFASLGLGKREKEVVQFEKVPVASLTFKPSSAGERTLLLNYRLRDFSGAVVETGQVTLDIKDLIPGSFALHPNYPNPFNPVTRIRFEVPEPARVRMTIYDILGREVISLVDKSLKPGYYEVAWDGRDSQGNHASSGMYIYRFRAKAFTATRKMILIR